MYRHSKKVKVDMPAVHEGLEKIMDNARFFHEASLDYIKEEDQNMAWLNATRRDSYLNSYFLITGIKVEPEQL